MDENDCLLISIIKKSDESGFNFSINLIIRKYIEEQYVYTLNIYAI